MHTNNLIYIVRCHRQQENVCQFNVPLVLNPKLKASIKLIFYLSKPQSRLIYI